MKTIAPRLPSAGPRLCVAEKIVDPFYRSSAWAGLVRTIKAQRGYRCEAEGCGRDCSRTPRALIGDHIVERKDGGADFDPLNVQLLCIGCHNRKTARERARRAGRAD